VIPRIGMILPIFLRIYPYCAGCENSDIHTIPTSVPGLQVRGMGIAISLVEPRQAVVCGLNK
jgi:hypothetical protein